MLVLLLDSSLLSRKIPGRYRQRLFIQFLGLCSRVHVLRGLCGCFRDFGKRWDLIIKTSAIDGPLVHRTAPEVEALYNIRSGKFCSRQVRFKGRS